MSDQIKAGEVFEPDIFERQTEQITAFNAALDISVQTLKELKEVSGSLGKNPLNTSGDLNKFNAEMQQSLILQQKYLQEVEKVAQQAAKAEAQELRLQQAKDKAAQAQTKQQAANAKATAQAQSAYYKLSQELLKNQKIVKDLLATGKALTESDKRLIKETQELDKRLKEIDATVGDHRRNVGAYREALNDIVAEMGQFGGAITRVVRTLKVLQEQSGETNSKLGKVLNVMKAGLIGVALFVVSAALEANKAANAMSELLQKASDRVDILSGLLGKGAEISVAFTKSLAKGLNVSLSEARTRFVELIDATIQFNAQMRFQKLELQKLNSELEDYNIIANDTTIGYNERIAAQKKSIELSEKIAAVNAKVAKSELDIINKEVKATEAAVGAGNASTELKNKQNEAQIKYNEALSASGTLELENAQKERQINIDKTNSLIDLTLKNKLAANSKKALLEEELKDEKNQLEKRREIAQELSDEQDQIVIHELEIFKKGNKIKFNSIELLKEQDAIILSQKLDELKTTQGLTLGDSARAELAKIIKQFQDSIVENKKTQKALDEEELKRTEKISKLTAEIAQIKLLQQEEDVKHTNDELKKKLEKNGTYYKKEVLALKISMEEEKSIKDKYLADQYEIDKQSIKDTVKDEKTKQKELEKLEQEYLLNKKKAYDNFENEREELDKKIEAERRKRLAEEANEVVDFTEQALKRKDDATEKQLNNDLDMRQRNILQQEQLAANGLDNILAFEKAAAAKDELAKAQLAKKQERDAKRIALFKLLASAAEKEQPLQALAESGTVMAVASAIAGSYFEGTENVAEDLKKNKVHNGRDGYYVAVDGGERIMTGDQNNKVGNLSNEELAQLAYYYNNGLLPKYITSGSGADFAENTVNSILIQQFAEMNTEMKSIKNALANRPVPNINLNKLGEVINDKIIRGLTISTKHKPGKSPLNYT